MFEQQGIMADGAVSKDAAISKMVAVLGGSSEWEAATKNVVEACYQKVSALGAQKDSQGCSVMAGSFMDCMPSMMFTVSLKTYELGNPLSNWCPFAK